MSACSRFMVQLDRGLDKFVCSGILMLALTLYLRSDVRSSWRALLFFLLCLAGLHAALHAKVIWQRVHSDTRKLLLYWTAFVLIVLLAAWVGNTFPGSQREFLLSFLLPAFLPFLVCLYINDKGRLRLLGWAFLGGLCITIFRNANQYLDEWVSLGGVPQNILLHRHYADALVFGLPFLLMALSICKQSVWRYFLRIILFVTLCMILLTGARGAWLATGVSLACFILLVRDRKLFYALMGASLLGAIVALSIGPGDIVVAKIQQGFDTSQRASGTWGPSLDMMADRPWLGYGFGSAVYHEVFNARAPGEAGWSIKSSLGPHNHLLAIGFAAGITGLGLFLLACFSPLLQMLRLLRRTSDAIQSGEKATWERVLGAAFCSLFLGAIFTQGMFEGRSWPPIAFWLGASLAWLGVYYRENVSDRRRCSPMEGTTKLPRGATPPFSRPLQ